MDRNYVPIVTKKPREEVLDGEEVFADSLEVALNVCKANRWTSASLPLIAEARVCNPEVGYKSIWEVCWLSASLFVSGLTKQGKQVVAFTHNPSYLLDPLKLKRTIGFGLHQGSAPLTRSFFYSLIDKDGLEEEGERKVWVLDYDRSNFYSLDHPLNKAGENPYLVAAFGGIDRLSKYVQRYHEKTKEDTFSYSLPILTNTPSAGTFIGLNNLVLRKALLRKDQFARTHLFYQEDLTDYVRLLAVKTQYSDRLELELGESTISQKVRKFLRIQIK